MRRAIVVTLVLALLAVTHCCAQKSTIDPNIAKPGATPAPTSKPTRYDPAKDPDKRMAQKVSYEAIHARLSSVIGGLGQASGVAVSCGKSKNDWQVRDIPVTIYAKDVPIGTLLRAIARATHNTIRTEKLDNGIHYRVMQDPKLTRQFADYDKAKDSFRAAVASWNWDCILALKDLPDSQLQSYGGPAIGSSRVSAMKKTSALFNALGPDYKQRALGGEPINLDPQKLPEPVKSAVIGVLGAFDQLSLAYQSQSMFYSWGQSNTTYERRTTTLPNDELERITLNLHLPESEDISLYNGVQLTAGGTIGLGMPASGYEYLKPDKNGKRPGPTPPTRPKIEENSAYDIDFPDISGKTPDALKTRVDMDDWAQKKGLNYAAVLEEMAKRAGVSIVMEDWDYFKEYPNSPQQWLRKGVALEEIRYYCQVGFDPDNKLMVSLTRDWADKHEALAPASVIDSLVQKVNGDGVDLEDLLPTMLLTSAQWQEWIQPSRDLSVISRHSQQPRDPLWQFFAQLTPQDRAQAATQEGLSMARFDPTVVSDLLTSVRKARDRQYAYSASLPSYPATPDQQGLARIVLHLGYNESRFYPQGPGGVTIPKSPDLNGKAVPRGLDKTYSYSLSMYAADNEAQTRYGNSSGPYMIPFYSKDREAELVKSVLGNGKPAPPNTTPAVNGNVIRL